MLLYKSLIMLSTLLLATKVSFADLKPRYISFALSTDKESYYEGEKITFNISIT